MSEWEISKTLKIEMVL